MTSGEAALPGEPIPDEARHPPDTVPRDRFDRLPPHPRLLLDAVGFARLREQVDLDARSAQLLTLLRRSGERILTLPPVDYDAPPGENSLEAIRDAEHRVFTLSMLVRLTGDARYVQGARQVLRGLADWPWPHRHYLDDATVCLLLGLGYDWLHDELDVEERERLAGRLHRGALAYTRDAVEDCGFLWAENNWNQISNSCLAIGALATAEQDPGLAHHIVNRSIALIPRAAAYAPDGIYPEGPGYWSYGTTYHVLLIEALRAMFGQSGGLDAFPGFLDSAAALDQQTGPSGRFFNFFDNRPDRPYRGVNFWFARETGRPDLATGEWHRLQAAADGTTDLREVALGVLWGSEPPASGGPPARPPRFWQGGGHQPVAVLRSSWDEPDATWVALKGGTSGYSHGHMDVGSFVLEAGGVRWALDPEIDDYLAARRRSGLTHAEFFGFEQDSARWSFFRLGPEGHNVLRFDGAPQAASGHGALAPIAKDDEGTASVTADLSATYAGQVERAQRRVTLETDGGVHITDTWTAPADRPVRATWQWLTGARAVVVPGGVDLDEGGRRLHLRADGTTLIALQDVADLLDPARDAPLPGLTRVVLNAGTDPGEEGRFDVDVRLDPARRA